MSNDEDVVLLRSFGYRYEGEFARSMLEAAGIQSALFVDDAGGAQVGLSFSNPARLMVRQEDLDAAQVILQEGGLLS